MVATPLSIADHLTAVAQKATLSTTDKGVIQLSLKNLLTRLRAEFDKYDVPRIELFGAFARDASLPHAMDKESDVDVMLVFSERGPKPAYFVEKLMRVALLHYPRPTIVQNGTTLYIELLHTRFDLVPAQESLRGMQIPVKGGDGWQLTDPAEDERVLKQKDAQNAGLVLPLLHLAKYWNARNDHPFDAYDLEKRVIAHSFAMAPRNLKAYFFDFMRSLHASPAEGAAKAELLRGLRRTLDEVDRIAQAGDVFEAVARMEAMLPLPKTPGGNPFLRRPV